MGQVQVNLSPSFAAYAVPNGKIVSHHKVTHRFCKNMKKNTLKISGATIKT